MEIPNYNEELERYYHSAKPSDGEVSALDKFLTWIGDIFDISPDVLIVIKYLFIAIVIGIFAFLIYKEFKGGAPSVKSRKSTGEYHGGTLQGTAEDANIQGHDFDRELAAALSQGDYALGVNLRYLMALKCLDEQRRIKWMDYKTPLMYVAELQTCSAELEELTMSFLYIKYGHYPADESVYAHAVSLFQTITFTAPVEKGGEA